MRKDGVEHNNKQGKKITDPLTRKKWFCGRTVTRDLELFGPLSDGPLALLELLRCLWTRLPGQNVLQLHIQLLLFLGGELRRQNILQREEEAIGKKENQ